MNREITGANGQIVTTWGRDSEGDLWIGPSQSMRWVCTCRCLTATHGPGFSTHRAILDVGWFLLDGEFFCTPLCAAGCEPEKMIFLIALAKKRLDAEVAEIAALSATIAISNLSKAYS